MPIKPVTPLSRLPNFDARKVAVLGVDSHLSAVMPERLQADALRQRFITPPLWQPEIYAEHRFTDRAPMHAAVLVAVVMREQLMVLLTERTAHLSNHSGQIAFADGKADATDADAAATALREVQEEVGLDPRFVQVLGNLPNYTTGTAFIITPVVALVQPDFVVTPNVHEVADVFEVPLQFLMNPPTTSATRWSWSWKGCGGSDFPCRTATTCSTILATPSTPQTTRRLPSLPGPGSASSGAQRRACCATSTASCRPDTVSTRSHPVSRDSA